MSSFTLDAGLRQIARAQLGLLTQRQAAEMGADKHALARRRATGALVELVPGVALVDPVTPSIEQLILAAGLAVPGSILTGSSGADPSVATPAATLLALPRCVGTSNLERCVDLATANGLVTVRALTELLESVPAAIEVDFAWTASRVALEVSPLYRHGSKRTQERDTERRRMLVEAGWRLIEATDRDVQDALTSVVP